MGNFALVVEFELKPGTADSFYPLIVENARASVANEPGCLQFDVVRHRDNPDRVVLYEVYADEAAFAAHAEMPHVAQFFAQGRPMIATQKATRCERLSTVRKA